MRVLEHPRIAVSPLAAPARAACRGNTKLHQGIDGFFPFANEDCLLLGGGLDHLGSGGLDHLGKAVQYPSNAFEIPYPPPAAIGTPLPKRLGVEANHLKEQLALLVGVIVGRDFRLA